MVLYPLDHGTQKCSVCAVVADPVAKSVEEDSQCHISEDVIPRFLRSRLTDATVGHVTKSRAGSDVAAN